MAFTLAQFIQTRPLLYHLTDKRNLEFIRASGQLSSAAMLLRGHPDSDVLRRRRPNHLAVAIPGGHVFLRDQAPLHEGNMQLEGGFSFPDFIEVLNGRVFFWPGDESGPIAYGVRHYERYTAESPVLLQVDAAALIQANPGIAPEFCRYNSGSPRCSNGRKSPRGASTFVVAEEASYRASQVVEATFVSMVKLPGTTRVGSTPDGPWQNLF